MPEEIVMPRLSDTMEEGTIAQWLKREGETVHKGEAILEVETDKANMELQAYSEGVIQKILQDDGATVAIGTVVGILGKPGEVAAPASSPGGQATQETQETPAVAQEVAADAPGAAPQSQEVPAPAYAAAGAAAPVDAAQAPARTAPAGGGNGASAGGRVRATPVARKIASEHNVDLVALSGQGSGPGGRIVKLDIEQYLAHQGAETAVAAPEQPAAAAQAPAPAQPAAPAGGDATRGAEMVPANRIQQVMARRLLESKQTVPHFYVTSEVDMAAAAALRAQLKETLGDEARISYEDLIIRACALMLRAMPDVNASWRDGQFARYSRVNVGVAVGLPDGLVVPVIKDADRKTLREISAERRTLSDKARNGKLAPSDMDGGTFSVSNLGLFDVEEFQAIINPPESAILAIGSVLEKAVVVDGQIVARPRMRVSLSVDHRVIPGVPAAQFLQGVKQLLQEPLRLGF